MRRLGTVNVQKDPLVIFYKTVLGPVWGRGEFIHVQSTGVFIRLKPSFGQLLGEPN